MPRLTRDSRVSAFNTNVLSVAEPVVLSFYYILFLGSFGFVWYVICVILFMMFMLLFIVWRSTEFTTSYLGVKNGLVWGLLEA